MKTSWWITLSLLVVAAVAAGCAQSENSAAAGKRVAVSVTKKGFEPAVVNARAGEPMTLVVTRKTDHTCAKQFVMADENIRRDLPLNQAVEITFTPDKPGDLRYACAMGMVSGTVHVQ